MEQWVTCDYHGTEELHLKEYFLNEPINLYYVETFNKVKEVSLSFRFQNNQPIYWVFINQATRDLEYERLLAIVKKGSFFTSELSADH